MGVVNLAHYLENAPFSVFQRLIRVGLAQLMVAWMMMISPIASFSDGAVDIGDRVVLIDPRYRRQVHLLKVTGQLLGGFLSYLTKLC